MTQTPCRSLPDVAEDLGPSREANTGFQTCAVEVEGWLHSLPLANATKAKIRNTMHVIFAHAGRHEWIATNPMTLVRQSAKRKKLPDVLELDELKKLLAELENPARALVFLTAATGLRVSEALGLKWSDVDFAAGEIRLSRAVVHQHVGDMKTEASQKPVPMDGALLDALQDWSRQAPYRQMGDWVFASRIWTANNRTGQKHGATCIPLRSA
jgi:integrase